ncbi:MAG: hypothetical protein OEY38_21730 [Gammaproteobacteria bacterium]|nr:hypothetical protein [Gammaproteobacteria bacterium]
MNRRKILSILVLGSLLLIPFTANADQFNQCFSYLKGYLFVNGSLNSSISVLYKEKDAGGKITTDKASVTNYYVNEKGVKETDNYDAQFTGNVYNPIIRHNKPRIRVLAKERGDGTIFSNKGTVISELCEWRTFHKVECVDKSYNFKSSCWKCGSWTPMKPTPTSCDLLP